MPRAGKRAGKTETFSVSVDIETKRILRHAADRFHDGNMSRLFAAVAMKLDSDEAFTRLWEWYGGPLPTDDERAQIDAELEGKPIRRKKRAA